MASRGTAGGSGRSKGVTSLSHPVQRSACAGATGSGSECVRCRRASYSTQRAILTRSFSHRERSTLRGWIRTTAALIGQPRARSCASALILIRDSVATSSLTDVVARLATNEPAVFMFTGMFVASHEGMPVTASWHTFARSTRKTINVALDPLGTRLLHGTRAAA